MKTALSLGFTLFLMWILWSGYFDSPLLLALGVVSSVLSAALAMRMKVADHEGHPIHLFGGLVRYGPWLVKAIAKSSIAVTRIVLSPKMSIDPKVIQVKASQQSPLGQVIYANSITLTPGTVALDLEDGIITVHAIDADSVADLLGGAMDRRVTAAEAAG